MYNNWIKYWQNLTNGSLFFKKAWIAAFFQKSHDKKSAKALYIHKGKPQYCTTVRVGLCEKGILWTGNIWFNFDRCANTDPSHPTKQIWFSHHWILQVLYEQSNPSFQFFSCWCVQIYSKQISSSSSCLHNIGPGPYLIFPDSGRSSEMTRFQITTDQRNGQG